MWFQSPAFLEWSRKQLLNEQNIDLIINTLDIDNDACILEVGCGSGELLKRLHKKSHCVCFGLDCDETLIEYAKQSKKAGLTFTLGDALSLPYEDSKFDIVISHTFLTSIFDAEKALNEMRRVCKEDGFIVSINADTFTYIPCYNSSFSEYSWFNEYKNYRKEIECKLKTEAKKQVCGLQPELVPNFFIQNHLTELKMYQLGKLFTLTGGNCSKEEETFINYEFEAEKALADYLDVSSKKRFIQILTTKYQLLKEGYVSSDWNSGSSLMLVARNKKENASYNNETIYLMTDKLISSIKKYGYEIEEKPLRIGIDSISSVTLSVKSKQYQVTRCAETPIAARYEAYKTLYMHLFFGIEGVFEPDDVFKKERYSKNETLKEYSILLLKEILEQDSTSISFEEELFEDEYNFREYIDANNNKFFVPEFLLDTVICCSGREISQNFSEAVLQAKYDICAKYALKYVLERRLTPPTIDFNQLKIGEKTKRILRLILDYGYNVLIFDMSCGKGIPALALAVTNSDGFILRCSADYDTETAIKKCIRSIFQGRKLSTILKGRNYYLKSSLSEQDVFNLITDGTKTLPTFLLSKCKSYSLREQNYMKSEFAQLDELFEELSWNPLICHKVVDGWNAVQIIVPNRQFCWSFSKKRITEFLLRQKIRSFELTKSGNHIERIERIAKFIERKLGWISEDTCRYIFGCHTPFIYEDVPLSPRLYLIALYLNNGEYEKAYKLIIPDNDFLKCLQIIILGLDESLFEGLYSSSLFDRAKRFANNPFEEIENQINKEEG